MILSVAGFACGDPAGNAAKKKLGNSHGCELNEGCVGGGGGDGSFILMDFLTDPTVLPMGTVHYQVPIINSGSDPALGLHLDVLLPDGTTSAYDLGDLAASATTTVYVDWPRGMQTLRQSGESKDDYWSRFDSIYWQSQDAQATLTWNGNATLTNSASVGTVFPWVWSWTNDFASGLPGERFSMPFSYVGNGGRADGYSAEVEVVNPAGPSTTSTAFDLASGGNASIVAPALMPAVAERGPAEPSADYFARLISANEQSLDFPGLWTFKDAGGSSYGPIERPGNAVRRLPIIWADLWGPWGDVPSGSVATFYSQGTNWTNTQGYGLRARFTFPGSAPLEIQYDHDPVPASGDAASASFDLQVPSVDPRGAEESKQDYFARLVAAGLLPLTLLAEFRWEDALGNHYGPVEQTWSRHLAVPVLIATSSSDSAGLPGQLAPTLVILVNPGNTQVCGGDHSTWFSGWLNGGDSTATTGGVPLPQVDPRDSAETSAAYLARLLASERPVTASSDYTWNDCWSAARFGPIALAQHAHEVLPIVVPALVASTNEAGNEITYQVQALNRGHAPTPLLRRCAPDDGGRRAAVDPAAGFAGARGIGVRGSGAER